MDITSCCRVCILLGVVLLVTSTRLVRYLPRPLRRFMPGGVDRNSSLRRHGSLHATSRDSSPSAVIHATTLHHLMSSPPKEKPWICSVLIRELLLIYSYTTPVCPSLYPLFDKLYKKAICFWVFNWKAWIITIPSWDNCFGRNLFICFSSLNMINTWIVPAKFVSAAFSCELLLS